MIYKEVKASERLPKNSRHYYTNEGVLRFNKTSGKWFQNKHEIGYWLEPIEITEEKIKDILEKHSVFDLPPTFNRYECIATEIIDLLK